MVKSIRKFSQCWGPSFTKLPINSGKYCPKYHIWAAVIIYFHTLLYHVMYAHTRLFKMSVFVNVCHCNSCGLFFTCDDPYLYDVIRLFKVSRVKSFIHGLIVLANDTCTIPKTLQEWCA